MIDIFPREFSRLLMWVFSWGILRGLLNPFCQPVGVCMSQGYSEDDLKRLSWQCRRGIKEVEVLLAPFFERFFTQLSAEDQARFVAFLEESDVDMFEWFMQRSKPEDPDTRYVVDVILARMAS